LVLSPGLLFTQQSVFGPTHNHHQHSGDLTRPHWHLLGAHRHHGHEHYHHGDHRHNAEAVDELIAEFTGADPVASHDDDAVYTFDEFSGMARVQTKKIELGMAYESRAVMSPIAHLNNDPEGQHLYWAHPPPRCDRRDFRLFVQFQTLLI
jgi:hypothetical protein